MKYSDLTEEQKARDIQLMEQIQDSIIQNISNMPADDRDNLLGVQDHKELTSWHTLVRIQNDIPLHLAARYGSPTMITALLEGVNAAQCKMLILGDKTNGIEGVVPKLVEGGHTNGIYNLIEGIKKVSSLNQEDKNGLLNDIREHLGNKLGIDDNALSRIFKSEAHNTPGGQAPAATAASPASGQNNGAGPAP